MAEKAIEKNKVKVKSTAKRKNPISITENGKVYVTATFNNTIITFTNSKGETVAWASAGSSGFKGTRKSTPFAASSAVEQVAKKAIAKGIKNVEVFVKGPGPGRDSSLRAIKTAGLSISMIADITPMPHNGPRASKKRRA
jgi:small subunit ribosomal protein S11